MRKFIKTMISFCLLLLLVAPLVAIFMLSKAEVKKYDPQPVPPLLERAYGEIFPVKRVDINETVAVSGTFVSTEKFFMELPKSRNPNNMRLLIKEGDEIATDQLIGYSEDLKSEIRADGSGIVLKITLGDISYITMESTVSTAFDCRADDSVMMVLKREGLKLSTMTGDEVMILSISKKQDDKGKTSVLLAIPNGVYGQPVDELQLKTGRIFSQVLVVDRRCLFQLNGELKKWYVRTVDENGNYLEDVEVKISYTSEDYVAISGVPEGTLCDSGYKKIVEDN